VIEQAMTRLASVPAATPIPRRAVRLGEKRLRGLAREAAARSGSLAGYLDSRGWFPLMAACTFPLGRHRSTSMG
jgi:hypothetical protein